MKTLKPISRIISKAMYAVRELFPALRNMHKEHLLLYKFHIRTIRQSKQRTLLRNGDQVLPVDIQKASTNGVVRWYISLCEQERIHQQSEV